MRRPKVLLFLISDLARLNGSVLWTENLLESLARVVDLDFIVISSWVADAHAANGTFIKRFGFDHIFVPFRQASIPVRNTRFERSTAAALRLLNTLSDKYYFLFERGAKKQKHVDTAVMEIIREERPDLIIIHDIWSAMCVPSAFHLNVPCCLITLNNEVDFHRAFRSQSGPAGQDMCHRLERWVLRHCNWIAEWRMHRHVNWLNRKCAGIVALTRDDLPTNLPDHVVQAVLPPLLKESALRWNYHASRCVFFVGNVAHFPNRLAVEWICSRLAPELYRIDDGVRINIIGANADQVRSEWQFSNIKFLGYANKEEVIHHMIADDLFIAPIANNFGAKLKLAECASYGMPFLASPSAMSGLPFLTFVPQIDLNKPGAAARLIVEYMDSPEALTHLSHSIAARMRQARLEQTVAWRDFLKHSMGVLAEENGSSASPFRRAPTNTE